jgi:hypothetical protein
MIMAIPQWHLEHSLTAWLRSLLQARPAGDRMFMRAGAMQITYTGIG